MVSGSDAPVALHLDRCAGLRLGGNGLRRHPQQRCGHAEPADRKPKPAVSPRTPRATVHVVLPPPQPELALKKVPPRGKTMSEPG
jgi:hypothetical protein